MMALEKKQNRRELKETLIELSAKTKDSKRIQWIVELIEYVFPDILGDEKDKILKIVEKKE